MRISAIPLLALAVALPIAAQDSHSSTTATVTSSSTGPASSTTITLANGPTRVTGSTVQDGVSASSTAARDQALLGELVTALAADPILAGSQIDVRIEKGHVTLSGSTRTPDQSTHAREIALGVAGQGHVTNRLAPQ